MNEKQMINSLLQDGSKTLQASSIFNTMNDGESSSRP